VRELEGTPALAYHSPHKGRGGHRGGDGTAVATDLYAQGRDVGADILMKEEEATVEATAGAGTTTAKKGSLRAKYMGNQDVAGASSSKGEVTKEIATVSIETKPVRKRKLNK